MQRYNIAKEGVSFVIPLIILYILFFAFWKLYLSLIALVFLLFVCYFFRQPERHVLYQGRSIISPAQGKVVRIDKRVEEEFLNEERLCVSIFLSVFDVHVNYAPCDGTVEKVLYKGGKFINAMNDKASLENEHASILIDTEKGKIVVRQIAGLIARRVVCHAKEGDKLKKGQKYGIIKFGSRVDIFLPTNFDIKAEIGEKVIAGLTEIAMMPAGDSLKK